jgi:gluconate 2-dehydrogenase gamma chain
MKQEITRRTFVRTLVKGGALYGAALVLNIPRPNTARAAAESSEAITLTKLEWTTLEAITGRIIPTDEEPGAIEANCVNFIDKALAHEDAVARPLYTAGLATIEAMAQSRFQKSFTELEGDQQDALLRDLEAGRASEWQIPGVPSQLFFETARAHTLIGFLADPKYGGNKDYAGWRVSGYPGPRHRMGGYSPAQMAGEAPVVPVWDRKS